MVGLVPAIHERRGRSPVSWPALCRPSTTGGADRGKVVDGRDKPGHDTMGTTVPPACYFNANGDTPDHDGGAMDLVASPFSIRRLPYCYGAAPASGAFPHHDRRPVALRQHAHQPKSLA